MRTFITILFFLYAPILLVSQILKGKVVDAMKSPIEGAYIFHESSEHHAHSNEFGTFMLKEVEVGDTLVISYLGYKRQEHIVEQKDFDENLTFTLEEKFFELDQINISNSVKTVNRITAIDLKIVPVNSSQEILRRVPGLIIGQHAGGGKAEQIFLRGFDVDHGTDISISVDGIPVNLVSHAHGQGYADLHFLIPETIQNIDFGKGPYYADQGNFTTAGYIDFKTKDKLDNSSIGFEYGQFNTFRTVALIDLLGKQEKQNAYIASEYTLTDGPVEAAQNFNRLNLMAKYSVDFENNDRLSILATRFQSKWDASGQIPQRLVDDGTISRFGTVDSTEGGNTSRTNIAIDYTKVIDNNTFLKTRTFFSHYDFELYSNFTFFLEDPVNGDQIRQFENRRIYGVNSTVFYNGALGKTRLGLNYGAGLRYDDINDNELSRTANRRTTLENLALGDVDETNIFGFINAEFDFGKWLINPGLRLDVFNFDYVDRLAATYTSLSKSKSFLSPKFNVIYNPNAYWQFYFKSGKGFHANDTRVVVAQNGRQILPAAYGADLGAIWKPIPRLWVDATLWYLFLDQEFVYVGDAAIVELGGKTVRRGVDLSVRYQLGNNWFFNTDLNYTYARTTEEPEDASFIPLAPELTSAGGITYKTSKGFTASMRYRYIKDRPANEDNSIVAKGYFITDFTATYDFKKITFGLNIENLFDQDWNEAQFATTSRLSNEAIPVDEIHFTPGVPFFIKGTIKYKF